MSEEKGYLALVLHAHLPFVRHPEYEEFLEEDWFFEALTETYIPFIEVFDRLIEDGVDFRLTMSITPTLLSMMSDPLLQYRYLRHLNKLIDLAGKEIERTRWTPEFHELALMYFWKLTRARQIFSERYYNNIIQAFKRYQDMGKIEIITCAATHGYLPLMPNRKAARAQIEIACAHYEKHFGRRPRGIWLPECGYAPGVDEILKQAGIKFFFIDTHGILFGTPRPRYGVFAPVYTPSAVAAFGRDMESSKQVWSAKQGYPGDYDYREFYRDVGFDLDYDYVRPYLHSDGNRVNLGIKYYRITGETEHKEPYKPSIAREKAAAHAGNFMYQPREADRVAARFPQDQADHRLAVRRGALRPLVVRGARVGRVPHPQDPFRPEDDQDDHAVGVSRAPPEAPGHLPVDVVVGMEGLQRGVAQRRQRLDLPASAHDGGPHGHPRRPLPRRGRHHAGARSTRRRGSSSSRRAATGRSS